MKFSKPSFGNRRITTDTILKLWRPSKNEKERMEDMDIGDIVAPAETRQRTERLPPGVSPLRLRNRKRMTKREMRVNGIRRRKPTLLSSEPTHILVLVNCGATGDVGGVFSSEIYDLFRTQKGFLRLEMGLGKPWSFVVCDSVESAIRIRSETDNHEVATSSKGSKPLWIEYAQRLTPDIVVTDPAEIAARIPGLKVVLEAVSEDEERLLLERMTQSYDEDSAEKAANDTLDETQSSQWITLLKRKVRHYGFHFDYPTNTAQKSCKLPRYVRGVVDRIPALPIFTEDELDENTPEGKDNAAILQLDQLTINEYWPGAGIGVHTDRHSEFKGPIVALSLRNGVVMEFSPFRKDRKEITAARIARRKTETVVDANGDKVNVNENDNDHDNDNENDTASIITTDTDVRSVSHNGFSNVFDEDDDDDRDMVQVYLPPRSLAVMSGASRYGWTHAIRPRKTDIVNGRASARENRVSFTFRHVRDREIDGECTCGYDCCD